MNKRGMTILETVGLLVLILIFLLIMGYFIRGTYKEAGTGAKQQVSSVFDDEDGDGINNALDSCPCIYSKVNRGCPYDIDIKKINLTEKYKDCSKEFCIKEGIKFCSE